MPVKTREERLFGAACVRLKLESAAGEHAVAGKEIYRAALTDLGLTEADVEAFLKANRKSVELLLEQARRRPAE